MRVLGNDGQRSICENVLLNLTARTTQQRALTSGRCGFRSNKSRLMVFCHGSSYDESPYCLRRFLLMALPFGRSASFSCASAATRASL